MPAHNEAENLPRALLAVGWAAPDFDLLIVNHGSSDHTAAVAASMGVTLRQPAREPGLRRGWQTGFRYAVMHGYDLGVVMDADGQHDPASILALVGAVESDGAEVAVGSRFRGRMDYHQPWVKRLGMRVFVWTASRITGRTVTDPTSGFQALNRDAMRFFARDNYPVDYPDADTLLILHYAGFRVVEVPVTMRERMSGISKMHSGLKPIYYVGKMWLAIAMVLLRQKTRLSAQRVESA